MCAPRPAPASKRQRSSAIWSSTPSAGRFRASEMDNILDNIGLPYSPIEPACTAPRADRRRRRRHSRLAQAQSTTRPRTMSASLRKQLPREFPGVTFYFLASGHRDPDSQLRPAGADRHSVRRRRHRSQPQVADKFSTSFATCPASSTCVSSSRSTIPSFNIDVDRTKAVQGGYTERDVASSLLNLAERQLPDLRPCSS